MKPTNESGYSLIELLMALWITAVALAIALPGFVRAMEYAQLQNTVAHVLSDIQLQQVRAVELQCFQEVRFAPFSDYYERFGSRQGVLSWTQFATPTRYEEGYLHLAEPNLRFDDQGDVSESGQIGLMSPRGEILDVVVYLQFGAIRLVHHMIS